MSFRLVHGDCIEVMRAMAADSVDAIVTDPPYGIGFMGREWDTFKPGVAEARVIENRLVESDNPNLRGRSRAPASSPSAVEYDYSIKGLRGFQEWTETWAREALRVLKPGGHAVVCGAPRAAHRMACGLEDAGFEIRDSLAWLFGQGFPKSLDIAKQAIDPDDAKRWAGWGTALKPGHEPIVLARKPVVGTIIATVLTHGTGALNIDACRIAGVVQKGAGATGFGVDRDDGYVAGVGREYQAEGRWPANVVLSHAPDCTDEACSPDCAVRLLDEQSGESMSAGGRIGNAGGGMVQNVPVGQYAAGDPGYGDKGGASRFFYCAKASREEREQGCEHLPLRSAGEATDREDGSAGLNSPRAGAGRTRAGKGFTVREIVSYPPASWVYAVLDQALPADTVNSLRKATVGSTIRASDGTAWSMCSCGSPSTDPSHPAIRSIIETATVWTTGSPTSNSPPLRHTNGCMAVACAVRAYGGSPVGFAESASQSTARTGISAEKDGRSTDAAVSAISVESWLTSEPAGEVGRRVGVRNVHPT